MLNRTLSFNLAAILLVSACAKETPHPVELSGVWKSEPVTLDRGDFVEAYNFTVTLEDSAGVMDIDYFPTMEPENERIIRQDLEVDIGADGIVLTGSNPRLVRGPAIEGVYEPDALYCDLPAPDTSDALRCGWGSAAHGEAPQVLLARQ